MTFTPGPWATMNRFSIATVSDSKMLAETIVRGAGYDYEAAANARLIAAAPELYEALKAIEAHHADLNARAGRNESRSKTLGIARAALAKADGGK